jgi:hypothetical protein
MLKEKLFFLNRYYLSAINGLETRYGSGTGTGTLMCQKSEPEPEP